MQQVIDGGQPCLSDLKYTTQIREIVLFPLYEENSVVNTTHFSHSQSVQSFIKDLLPEHVLWSVCPRRTLAG